MVLSLEFFYKVIRILHFSQSRSRLVLHRVFAVPFSSSIREIVYVFEIKRYVGFAGYAEFFETIFSLFLIR